MLADKLTFVINPEDKSAPFGLLLKSLEDISRLLRDVDYAIYQVKPKHGWIVSNLESSAPTITLEPERRDSQTVSVIIDGLRAVIGGTDQPPPYFTEPVLEDLRKMRRLFNRRRMAKSIFVSVNGEQTATIQQDISEKVGHILTAGYHNIGSVQGTLEAINVHGSPKVTIWDRVSRAPVRCLIPQEEEWIDHVKGLLRRRVSVTGNVHYFVNGIPRSINRVVTVQDDTPDPNLPRAEFGSIPDVRVREIGAAEWIKTIRGLGQG